MPVNRLRVNHYDFVALHLMWIIFLKGLSQNHNDLPSMITPSAGCIHCCITSLLTVLLKSACGQSPMIKLLQTLSSENLMSSAGGSPLKTYPCVIMGTM